MREYIIYKITAPSGKSYIGITSQGLGRRRTEHARSAKTGAKTAIHRAIRKYGIDMMVWEILEKCNDIDELKLKEGFYINKFNTFKRGYNETLGGDGTFGKAPWNKGGVNVFSKKTLEKMRLAKLGKKRGPHSAEHRLHISESQKGKPRAHKTTKGYKQSEEARIKNCLKSGGRPFLVWKAVLIQRHRRGQGAKYIKGDFVGEWLIQGDCAKTLGTSQGCIGACLRGKSHQAKGYIFQYKE